MSPISPFSSSKLKINSTTTNLRQEPRKLELDTWISNCSKMKLGIRKIYLHILKAREERSVFSSRAILAGSGEKSSENVQTSRFRYLWVCMLGSTCVYGVKSKRASGRIQSLWPYTISLPWECYGQLKFWNVEERRRSEEEEKQQPRDCKV